MRIENNDDKHSRIKLIISLDRDEALGLIAALATSLNEQTPASLRVPFRTTLAARYPHETVLIGVNVIADEEEVKS